MAELKLEWRDPKPLKLAMLDLPASVAPSSTDSRGLTTVDGGDALETAVSESSGESARCFWAFPSASSCLVESAKVILAGATGSAMAK